MTTASGSNVFLVPSVDSLQNSIRMSNQTDVEIVADYLKLPKLPYGETIRIDKIACINYDPITKESMGMLTYKLFRQKCSQEFPECRDPNHDYTDDDYVSPAIIISGDKKYRVKMVLWNLLCDAFSQILLTQSIMNKKLFPTVVSIDEQDEFIAHLFNLGLSPPTAN